MKVYTGMEQLESLIASTDFCMRCWVVHLMIFSCKVKIFPLLKGLPQRTISYFVTEWKYAQ